MIIDWHNHFYPDPYIKGLSAESTYARVERDTQGRLLIHYEGDYNIVVGPHIDIEERLKGMDRAGIDVHVLTLTTPSVERETPETGLKLAQSANDGYRDIIEEHPERFTALAALPLQDPEAAAVELERAVEDLGLRGGTLMSNINGRPLDIEEMAPVYEKAVRLDVPLYIHPTSPINNKAMGDYRLVPILGFGVDTSLAVLRLVFSGTLERYPTLKVVASHLGGVYPYLRGRIDTGYHAYPECKENISRPPSHYLEKIFMDSIIYNNDVLLSALAFCGPEKIVLGSDDPHQIGDIEHAVERIRDLEISEDEKNMILSENARKLLKI
ncbi:MAG: amidohydrolase family protein [Candidatus Bathyarchaeota archaeon]|jgi:aminocarboxymuconate-semialdehyde decarboxylase